VAYAGYGSLIERRQWDGATPVPGAGPFQTTERSFFLKMGYYSYSYVTVDKNDPAMKPSFAQTEGNHVETENDYMILVYYRALGSRADELVGITRFNSLNK